MKAIGRKDTDSLSKSKNDSKFCIECMPRLHHWNTIEKEYFFNDNCEMVAKPMYSVNGFLYETEAEATKALLELGSRDIRNLDTR